MVLDITIDSVREPTGSLNDDDAYTVHVDSHRIFTIFPRCHKTAAKWLKSASKAPPNSKLGFTIIAVSFDSQIISHFSNWSYHLLQLCVGSHCLLHLIPDDMDHRCSILKDFRAFFDNPRVLCVGMDIDTVAKKLLKRLDIKIMNPMDLGSLAAKGLEREDLDLKRYDLDRLAKAVVGNHMDVARPEDKVQWFERGRLTGELTIEKIKFATVDSYLSFLIGSDLLEKIHYPDRSSSSSTSFSAKKEKKKNKKNKKYRNACLSITDSA